MLARSASGARSASAQHATYRSNLYHQPASAIDCTIEHYCPIALLIVCPVQRTYTILLPFPSLTNADEDVQECAIRALAECLGMSYGPGLPELQGPMAGCGQVHEATMPGAYRSAQIIEVLVMRGFNPTAASLHLDMQVGVHTRQALVACLVA